VADLFVSNVYFLRGPVAGQEVTSVYTVGGAAELGMFLS
jgi:hypothetical protein